MEIEMSELYDLLGKKWPPEKFDVTIVGPRTEGGYLVFIRRAGSVEDIHRLEAKSYREVLTLAIDAEIPA